MATRAKSAAAPHTQEAHHSALLAARAKRELQAIEEAIAALEASRDGLSQRQIASKLGRSQSDVHRLLRRAGAGLPSQTWKLLLSAAAGEITRGDLIGRLRPGLARGAAAPGEQVDGYVPSDLDDVRRAFMDGYIDEDDYNEIRGAAPLSQG